METIKDVIELPELKNKGKFGAKYYVNNQFKAELETYYRYMKEKYGFIQSVKHRQLSWTNASEQGFNDGKNTELYKPIQQSRETQINNVKLLG